MNNIPTTSPPADAFVGDETKDVELQASEPSDATLNSAENLEGQSDHEVVEEKTGFSTVKFKTIITGTLNGTQKLEGISTFPKASVAGNTEDVEVPTSESSNGTLSRGENLEEDKSSVDDNSDAADDAAVKRKRPGFAFTTKTFVAAVKSKRRGFASTTKTLVAVAGCFFFVVAIVLAFIFGLKGNDPDGVLGEVLPPFLLEPQEPSASPSFAPSGNPTAIHSSAPSPFPSSAPTTPFPSDSPTRSPTPDPTPDPTPEPSPSPTCSTEGTIKFYSKPDCTGSKKLSVKVPDGRGETTLLDRMSHYDVWSAAFVGPISKGVFLTVGRDESGRPFTSVGEMVVETDIPCGATVCVKSFESFPANGGGRYGSVRLQSSLVGGDRLGGGDLNYGKIYNPHHPSWATAVIGSPKWGDYFSEENGGWSQPRDNRYPVVGMTASWGWGDNKKLMYATGSMCTRSSSSNVKWTHWFGHHGDIKIHSADCLVFGSDYYVAGAQCRNHRCQHLRLKCARLHSRCEYYGTEGWYKFVNNQYWSNKDGAIMYAVGCSTTEADCAKVISWVKFVRLKY